MSSAGEHGSEPTFLATAVRLGYVSAEDAERLEGDPAAAETDVALAAVHHGLIDAVQADIVQSLCAPADVAPGYEVMGVLGHGGLGVVFRARQTSLDRAVALKTILLARMQVPGIVGRFQQEARVVARLAHPNIVAVYDCGTHRQRIFMAMELVEGTDLERRIERQGPLGERAAWHVVRQVAAGLAHAAAIGVVHRDIKPANLLLTAPPAGFPLPNGVPLVKISDFGLAQLRAADDAAATRLTAAGTTMGTPAYMAPEQLCSATVDHRADIYALGATMFHMLTGAPPMSGETAPRIMAAKLVGDQAWLDALPPSMTLESRELLRAMLATDPNARPSDYADLIARIDALPAGSMFDAAASEPSAEAARLSPTLTMAGAPTAAFAALPKSDAVGELGEGDRAPAQHGARGATRRWWLAAIAAALAVTSIGVAAWSLGSRGVKPPAHDLVASGWEAPLFDGQTLAGFTRQRGQWAVTTNAEGARVLAGSGSVVRTLPRRETSAPLADFRVRLGVDLHDAATAGVHFAFLGDDRDRSDRLVLRWTTDGAEFGRTRGAGGMLEPLSNRAKVMLTSPSSETPIFHELRIERQRGHWFAWCDGKLVGWQPAGENESIDAIQLVVEGGTAHFEDLAVAELVAPAIQ